MGTAKNVPKAFSRVERKQESRASDIWHSQSAITDRNIFNRVAKQNASVRFR